jgi:uncharacterized protein (TIGR00255 family)
MIVSMTGYGAAQHTENGVCHALELRSVNNRYLKLSIKLPEHLQFAESDIDKLLRHRLARGTVSYTVRVRSDASMLKAVDLTALQRYVDVLSQVRLPSGVQPVIDLATVASLPGVSDPPDMDDEAKRRCVEVLTELTNRGLNALIDMRREEGRTLHDDLLVCSEAIRKHLSLIAARAPGVIDEYRERLRSRVATLMQGGGFQLEADGLLREIAVFAERCDISEEISRLTSHLDQFAEVCDRDEQVGRTLDFLAQEMLREANTIGSKSNDATIARNVVEIKGLIDRLKEQVQNVE